MRAITNAIHLPTKPATPLIRPCSRSNTNTTTTRLFRTTPSMAFRFPPGLEDGIRCLYADFCIFLSYFKSSYPHLSSHADDLGTLEEFLIEFPHLGPQVVAYLLQKIANIPPLPPSTPAQDTSANPAASTTLAAQNCETASSTPQEHQDDENASPEPAQVQLRLPEPQMGLVEETTPFLGNTIGVYGITQQFFHEIRSTVEGVLWIGVITGGFCTLHVKWAGA
jgi:hypothetical protein